MPRRNSVNDLELSFVFLFHAICDATAKQNDKLLSTVCTALVKQSPRTCKVYQIKSQSPTLDNMCGKYCLEQDLSIKKQY